jgi:hypothetical protein
MAHTDWFRTWVVNSSVLPTHPVVPNPYTLLSCTPSDTYFSVLDIKDAFFTIPLHPDCHNLFAFMWEDPALGLAQKLTWTVLPQGFRDNPHFFGQTLAQDLSSLDLQPSTLLQYMLMISFSVAPPYPLSGSHCLTTQLSSTKGLSSFTFQGSAFPTTGWIPGDPSDTDLQTDYSKLEGPHQVIDGPFY